MISLTIHNISASLTGYYIGICFNFSLVTKGSDEKTLVNYDELDEVTEEGDPIPKTHSILKRLPTCPCEVTKRYTIAMMSSLGFLISFGIRCNMGVAILQMTSNKTSHSHKASAVSITLQIDLFITTSSNKFQLQLSAQQTVKI